MWLKQGLKITVGQTLFAFGNYIIFCDVFEKRAGALYLFRALG